MATKYATHAEQFRKAKADGPRAGTLRGDLALADLSVIQTTFTIEADSAAADVVKLTGPLPEGLMLVPALSRIAVETDPGTTLTIDIGNATDADVYADGIDCAAVGIKELGTLKTTGLTASEEILATFATAASLTTDAVITFYLVFRSVS